SRRGQTPDQVVPAINHESWLLLHIDEFESARQQIDCPLEIATVFQRLRCRDQGSTHPMAVARLLVERMGTIKEGHRLREVPLASSEGRLELQDLRFDLDIARHTRGEKALRVPKGRLRAP